MPMPRHKQTHQPANSVESTSWRPILVPLEDCSAPAILVNTLIDTNADDGFTTLREAIAQATTKQAASSITLLNCPAVGSSIAAA